MSEQMPGARVEKGGTVFEELRNASETQAKLLREIERKLADSTDRAAAIRDIREIQYPGFKQAVEHASEALERLAVMLFRE